MIRPPDYPEEDDSDYINYGNDDGEWGDVDAECEAYGGIGCKHLACQHWGGDGLCFIAMNEGY